MAPSQAEQIKTLVEANAELRAANGLLEQKVKTLQVAVTVFIAIALALCAGLAARAAGGTMQIALGLGITVLFAMIMASIAILTYLRRSDH